MTTPDPGGNGGLDNGHQPEPPATPAAAVGALWGRLRLVVVDLETVSAADGTHAVEVGIVICRGGRRTSSWSHRVNPGVPVDDFSFRIHDLADADLADEPAFEAVAPEVLRRLRGVDGEHVVVVAHNAGFDVGVLRQEFERLGQQLPDLTVLDTARLARVRELRIGAAGGKLEQLVEALRVVNVAPHTARGDAEATADAVIAMFDRAAAAGLTDFDALLAAAKVSRTTTIRYPARRRRPEELLEAEVDLPEAHTAGHAVLLTSDDPALVSAWQTGLSECATLRCPYAADRVAAVELPDARALVALETLPATAVNQPDPDVPAVATLLGTLLPLLERLPDRATALRWHDEWAPVLAGLGRCPRTRGVVSCPDCRASRPCPLDAWYDHLAVAARAKVTTGSTKSFLHVSGENIGAGVFTTWVAAGRHRLAEAVAWRVYQEHRAASQEATAHTFARYIHRAGGREPRLVTADAALLAAPGSEDALERGIKTCDEALLGHAGSTAEGWAELRAKRGQLAGRLTRLQGRLSDDLDEDGNPVPVRRHHPDDPRRLRARRFSAQR